MATENQRNYIADLAVIKTKEFKEVKELLTASGIVSSNADIVGEAETIADITNALTNLQASKFIDLLIATKEPARGRIYSKNRIIKTAELLDDIKVIVDDWAF